MPGMVVDPSCIFSTARARELEEIRGYAATIGPAASGGEESAGKGVNTSSPLRSARIIDAELAVEPLEVDPETDARDLRARQRPVTAGAIDGLLRA